jgi:hypothetical protein
MPGTMAVCLYACNGKAFTRKSLVQEQTFYGKFVFCRIRNGYARPVRLPTVVDVERAQVDNPGGSFPPLPSVPEA